MVRGGLETRCGWVFAAERCGPINACDRGDGLGRGAGTVPGGLGEDVAKAVPNVDDDALDTQEVKSSDPAVDEKKLESNTTNVNETVSAVNATGADTGLAVTDGFHQVSKHADKVPVNVGLPVKRQAPEFLRAPVDEPEVADPQIDSPLHKHIVPLQ